MEFKILLVENQPAVLKMHKTMLEEMGHKPDVAEDGLQALSMIADNDYNLILMNIGLPDLDGIEVATVMRRLEKNKRTPVIALTPFELDEVEAGCLAAGIDKVLIKPVTIDRLRQLLDVYSIKYQA